MLAVGIDISKSKSVAAILNQDGSMHTSPFEFHHTQPELDAFIKYILNSNQSATILMENTGHYHYPVLKAFREAGLPVCMVNAYQIKKFGDMDLRKAKTDKKDAVRIARYALEKSYSLVPYTSMEQKYEDLKFLARQYNQRMLTLKTNKVFLLNLLDETMPGITNILPLTTRTPETSLSVLFINRFKSYDRIKKMGKSRFLDAFEKITRKSRNRQTKTYGLAIYEAALRNITTRGENEYTLAAQDQCLELVCESQKAADSIILKMQTLAETLPEYAVLRSMAGVGDSVHLSLLKLAISAAFTVEKHSTLMLVTMRLHISLEHLRATIATYQNVGMRLSESIALRLCRHSNLHNLKMTLSTFFCSKRNRKGNHTT